MTVLTYTGRYRADDGSQRIFHLTIPARTMPAAERVLDQIAATGVIDGELIEEGEAPLPFQVGHA